VSSASISVQPDVPGPATRPGGAKGKAGPGAEKAFGALMNNSATARDSNAPADTDPSDHPESNVTHAQGWHRTPADKTTGTSAGRAETAGVAESDEAAAEEPIDPLAILMAAVMPPAAPEKAQAAGGTDGDVATEVLESPEKPGARTGATTTASLGTLLAERQTHPKGQLGQQKSAAQETPAVATATQTTPSAQIVAAEVTVGAAQPAAEAALAAVSIDDGESADAEDETGEVADGKRSARGNATVANAAATTGGSATQKSEAQSTFDAPVAGKADVEAAADTGAKPQPDLDSAASARGEPQSERLPAGPLDAKSAVTGVQTATVPVTPASTITPTGASLVASIAADGTLASYASEMASALPTADTRPITTLKLQLNPIELGNVTVSIAGKGDEISVEIQVENLEAQQRLSSDTDAIVKSLRGLGFEVDRFTVQQVAPTANAGQQQSTGGNASSRGDGFAAFDQREGERGQGQQQHANSGGRNDGQEWRGSQGQPDRRAADAVYI
jgi:chemotaxis protein MotD